MARKSASIILASASPRRRRLLADAGYRFNAVPPDIDESRFFADGISPSDYAEKVALAKAANVAQKHPKSLVIGADTIVDYEGQIVGKPVDAKDAEKITRNLFSRPHKVITAIALVRLSDHTEIVESDTTAIYPRKLTEQQIAEHIAGGAWRDKSGAYAIRENGDEFIEKVEGSVTNVMGLPMELLQKLMTEFIG
jgi:septum formation protein